MVEHIVLFKVKAGVPAEEEDRMLQDLRGLVRLIPSIRELTCGKNLSSRNQGFTHGLFVRFGSREDLDSYINHPDHQLVVAERIRPLTENIIVVDYEV